MGISDETMRGIIRDYQGIEISDEELELIRPEIDSYLEAMSAAEDLDLAGIMSGRLLHSDEGGVPDAE